MPLRVLQIHPGLVRRNLGQSMSDQPSLAFALESGRNLSDVVERCKRGDHSGREAKLIQSLGLSRSNPASDEPNVYRVVKDVNAR